MTSKKHLPSLYKLSSAVLVFSFVMSAPATALAASSNLEVSGWIPYWRTEAGAADARAHLEQFTEVNPFGYTVRADGSLNDAMGLDKAAWVKLAKESRAKKVRFVPSIMWSDANAMHAVLSDPAKRKAHVKAIVQAVEDNKFDGIDIDYEGKRLDTRDSYSAFLKELSTELKKSKSPKWLDCTVEVRMTPESRGTSGNVQYATDLAKVNKYCDRVRAMTYDQQTADVELNRKHNGKLYAPVSDTAWVEKVINYMDNDVDKKKLVMGIPTYGYVWQVMPKLDGSGYTYIKTDTFNPQYGHNIAKEYGLTPVRGASGEMTLSYVPKETNKVFPTQAELSSYAPKSTASGLLAALGAIAYAKEERRQTPITYLTWSDAGAIKQKIDLATKLGVAGVAIFKIDGGEDAGMWSALPSSAPKNLTAPKGTVSSSDSDTPAPTPTPAPVPGTPPTSTTGYVFTTDLEYTMESPAVLQLQKVLAAEGYLSATPNGVFGPATLAALRAWQTANGLPSTGYFGPMSRAKMNAR